ncbi:hypothetical protein GCM10010174_03730 [Kutzneria viridogrisea]|uniref:Uncharacterized protein n=1 Tax=Kutzneria viridogrisea TaxID=47990 RepID=A0ABR6BRD2_9PSEU|nr:hypothetical protein [Kutzneria viridogrisea]
MTGKFTTSRWRRHIQPAALGVLALVWLAVSVGVPVVCDGIGPGWWIARAVAATAAPQLAVQWIVVVLLARTHTRVRPALDPEADLTPPVWLLAGSWATWRVLDPEQVLGTTWDLLLHLLVTAAVTGCPGAALLWAVGHWRPDLVTWLSTRDTPTPTNS